MAGRVPPGLQDLPSPAVSYVSRPTVGRTVASYANVVNHLTGMRGLRVINGSLGTGVPILSSRDIPPVGPGTTCRLRWVVSPVARYIWWGGFIAADVTSTGTFLRVYLETPAGAAIDGPIEFTRANGRLPARLYVAGGPPSSLGSSAGRDVFIHSGWAEASAGTAPRLLDANGFAGQDVQIRVETNNVRVYSHCAIEAYRVEL